MTMVILYIFLAAVFASFYYWIRIRRYGVDHELDELLAVLVGVFFPVTIPFAFPFAIVRWLNEKF